MFTRPVGNRSDFAFAQSANHSIGVDNRHNRVFGHRLFPHNNAVGLGVDSRIKERKPSPVRTLEQFGWSWRLLILYGAIGLLACTQTVGNLGRVWGIDGYVLSEQFPLTAMASLDNNDLEALVTGFFIVGIFPTTYLVGRWMGRRTRATMPSVAGIACAICGVTLAWTVTLLLGVVAARMGTVDGATELPTSLDGVLLGAMTFVCLVGFCVAGGRRGARTCSTSSGRFIRIRGMPLYRLPMMRPKAAIEPGMPTYRRERAYGWPFKSIQESMGSTVRYR